MPREYFNKTLLLNKKLKQEKEKLSMKVFGFRQEKMETNKLFKESKAWSLDYLKSGGPLTNVDWED